MGPLTIEHQTKTDIDLVIGEIYIYPCLLRTELENKIQ